MLVDKKIRKSTFLEVKMQFSSPGWERGLWEECRKNARKQTPKQGGDEH